MSVRKLNTWDLPAGLPVLILAASSGDPKDPDRWAELTHQGAGHACTNFSRFCLLLPIRSEMLPRVKALTQKWFSSDLGAFSVSLTSLNEYSKDLSGLGLSCDVSYSALMEGVYPFDTVPGALQSLTPVDLPADLDELLVSRDDIFWKLRSFDRWEAFILGENSD
jgi:hypothetical protein